MDIGGIDPAVHGMNFMKRPRDQRPLDPACKLALRRICGTCAHFRGDLFPPSGQSNYAECARYNVQKSRLHSAAACHAWTRKGVQNV